MLRSNLSGNEPASERINEQCGTYAIGKLCGADNVFKFYWRCEARQTKLQTHTHRYKIQRKEGGETRTNTNREREREIERRKKFLKYFQSLEFLFEIPQTVSALRVIFYHIAMHFYCVRSCVRVCVRACVRACLHVYERERFCSINSKRKFLNSE